MGGRLAVTVCVRIRKKVGRGVFKSKAYGPCYNWGRQAPPKRNALARYYGHLKIPPFQTGLANQAKRTLRLGLRLLSE